MDRRQALRWLVAAAGARWLDGLHPEQLLAWGREAHARARPAGEAAPEALEAHASRTVIAAAERIIPATDTPGATDAGVGAFIDHMLAGWYPVAERARFLEGLSELDDRSRAAHGRDFADCTGAQQDALLSAYDDEVAALRRMPPDRRAGTPANPDDHWFAMLKFLTVWGYCTSEVGQRETLRSYPLPGRYEACAPHTPTAGPTGGGA